MRPALVLAPVVLLVLGGVAVACSSSGSSPSGSADPDAAIDVGVTDPGKDASSDTSPVGDAGPDVVETPTIASEVEPNNGTTTTEVGTMALPGTMNGKIDPANDIDLFTINLMPGDLWDWTATPTTGDLAPHITVFDTAASSLNPTVIGPGAAGSPAKLEHFVLRPGSFVVGMRDARNVGMPSANKGGPTFGYALTAKRGTKQPVAVTFPVTKSGTLASLGAIDLYTFSGTSGKGFDITVRAARKVPASTLDSRLSLFDITAKKALITNDNAAGTTDSQVGSPDAAPSTYMVIVENEGTNAADLSYEIEFALRP